MMSLTNVEKALVLQQNQPRATEQPSNHAGATDSGSEFATLVLNKHWFYCKTSPEQPSNQAAMLEQRIRGLSLQHSFLEEEWGTLTDKLFREKALVLLCFRSRMLKKQWFYLVFDRKCWKSIGFTLFSIENCEKAMVLLCFRSKQSK